MRLRKNMKRAAAAVLALSMAVSAAAMPASAGYSIDMSQVTGDITITKDASGKVEVTGSTQGVINTGDEDDSIIITGDNTKPAATESLNAAEENADEVEKPTEAEKPGEAGKSAEGEDEGDEPTSQELLAPEDEEKKDEQKPAETQETAQDEKPTDKVLLYDQYDPESQQEATKQEATAKKDTVYGSNTVSRKSTSEDTATYENENKTPIEKAAAAFENAVNYVVKIINNKESVRDAEGNVTEDNSLKITLDGVTVDAGDRAKNAMTITGNGDVTLELDGKNELTGGSGIFENDYHNQQRGDGVNAFTGQHGGSGRLTIKGSKDATLTATGGSGTNKGGFGIYAGKLDLEEADITANGGAGSGDGVYALNDNFNIKNSKLTANGGTTGNDTSSGGRGIYSNAQINIEEGSEVIATGGDARTENENAKGGTGIAFWYNGLTIKKGGKLTATGGNAESEKGNATGGNAFRGDYGSMESSGETMLIGGNAKSGEGNATGGNAIFGDGYYLSSVTVKEGTMTALGGTAESDSSTASSGESFKNGGNQGQPELIVEKDGVFITARPGDPDDNGNGIGGNVIISTVDGKIEEIKNAKVVKNKDGSVTVKGELVGVQQEGHHYEVSVTEPTCTTPGKIVYHCMDDDCTETYEETIDALGHEFVNGVCTRCGAPEQAAAENGGSSAVTLTVTGAGAYETSVADGRYIIAVPAETAVLSGCLSNLKELKAQGATTVVFRTQLRETVLNIDSMLSMGVDDTLFTLTHNGEGASLTIGGFEHNELIH